MKKYEIKWEDQAGIIHQEIIEALSKINCAAKVPDAKQIFFIKLIRR